MHILKTHTLATPQFGTFLVYWTNSSIRLGGLLKVRIAAQIDDAHIAAELAAIQHLLEDKKVAGHGVIGNANTQLIVSLGAIRKLQRKESDKTHLIPYANFLTTRFAGCKISVEKDARWFEGFTPVCEEELVVEAPRLETVRVTGLGEVFVTQHVLERFADRFLSDTAEDKIAQVAWKRLRNAASDSSLQEVVRHGIWSKTKYARQGKPEGRYFLSARRNLVLVITEDQRKGKQLVTTYPATTQFKPLLKAA